MHVKGFDGKERSLKTKSRTTISSSLHNKCREILKNLFPFEIILEEITLPGSKKTSADKNLIADFFIPSKKLVIEVHGRQHYEFCAHFHGDKHKFLHYKKRDKDKVEWCELNGITIVELPYDATDWRERIIRKFED